MTTANYITLTFILKEEEPKHILLAWLSELNYEGFEETPEGLKAFIPEKDFNEGDLRQILTGFPFQVTYEKEVVEPRNWNEVWEKNFDPVVIDEKVIIRAGFHPADAYPYEIIIDPKMSFGTGHHETTAMMISFMLGAGQDFAGKSVLDFGSGTGILSIMAAKLGAKKILAIDHEDWAYHNAIENFKTNGVITAEAVLGEAKEFSGRKFDTILANINRNIILQYFADMCAVLNNGGKLYCSGFLHSDEKDIIDAANRLHLKWEGKKSNGNWVALSFLKNN